MKQSKDDINRWLARLGEGTRLDDRLNCYLQGRSGQRVMLTLSADHRYLLFYCPLLPLHGRHRSLLMEEALGLNLYQSIAIKGTLGFDEQNRMLAYTFVSDLGDDSVPSSASELWDRQLTDVMDNADMLAARFQRLLEMADAAPEPSSHRNLSPQQGTPLLGPQFRESPNGHN
ncbi:CesT family type III secretion system chaperone [Pokkaliibacter sp. MBI-7]|uniref:CesT family type III secretion system chaperone n=1 Tax=Pokkaliibacter sp. MBI-7 TaxID=3040600 RepID=UPI0024494039|nr:CesT family type III secretion system chaperone [Pokkaliibacter sp. MBI-7]MDH2434859.1 CesT family type III secretion system chaperone [Pokkaliibacter sp. MBI-7]